MDNEIKVIFRVLKEHDSRILHLNNKVKWLEKERVANKLYIKALHAKLDSLKDSDIQRMI